MSGRTKVGFAHMPEGARFARWTLPVAPPLIFLTLLVFRYALVMPVCQRLPAARAALELGSAVALAATLLVGVLANRARGRLGDEPPVRATSDDFLLELALLETPLFALAIVAMWMPSWLLSPCPT